MSDFFDLEERIEYYFDNIDFTIYKTTMYRRIDSPKIEYNDCLNEAKKYLKFLESEHKEQIKKYKKKLKEFINETKVKFNE